MSHSTALLPSKFINDFCLLFFPIFFFAPSPISFILARNLENKSRTINFEGKRSWKVLRLSFLPSLCLGFECQNPHSRSENFSFSNFLFFFEKKFFFNMLFFTLCCKKSYKNFFFFKNFCALQAKEQENFIFVLKKVFCFLFQLYSFLFSLALAHSCFSCFRWKR